MRSLNRIEIIGFLGAAPEVRYTGSGTAVASFTVATNEEWKNEKAEKVESVQWHKCVAWRKLADVCDKLLTKGSLVHIAGKMAYRDYEKDGQKHHVSEIVIDELIVLAGFKEQPQKELAPVSGTAHS